MSVAVETVTDSLWVIRLVLDELDLSDGGKQLLELGVVDRLAGRRVLELDSERTLIG